MVLEVTHLHLHLVLSCARILYRLALDYQLLLHQLINEKVALVPSYEVLALIVEDFLSALQQCFLQHLWLLDVGVPHRSDVLR